MHVDDCVDALVFLMQAYSESQLINVGTGQEIVIGDLAQALAQVVGYKGRLVFDASKPDGMPRKLLNSSRILAMGWRPRVELAEGLRETYRWFLSQRKVGS
jgi:GDP-L-fucose synthase